MSETAPPEPSDVSLRRFFESSPAALKAASSLKKSVEVSVRFTDVPGDYRFHVEGGKPHLDRGTAEEPDFELTLAPGAVKDLCAHPNADVGDLGVLFFQHMLAKEEDQRIRAKLHSGLIKLTFRGWLSVIAAGGPKVVGWMASKGLKGPSAIAAALSRLKGG